MTNIEKLKNKQASLSVIGLGYVGLPVAVAFSKKVNVIGFDLNHEKIQTYQKGIDPTGEVGDQEIADCLVKFTSDEDDLQQASYHIVAVPTPIKKDKTPDLSMLKKASEQLGRQLSKGSVVIFESTVYPGVTEDICVPILEASSGLMCGRDFKVGYSPERINPGDQVHRLESIVKVVSGMDQATLEEITSLYELVVTAGVYQAESIKVAEAAKVIENAQRDINIAFMNELAIIFDKLEIDTKAVLAAAGTKWNFLNFRPGLVGGHCIGVDPYYLTYKAEEVGYHSQIILAGRRINDGMGKYVVEQSIKRLIKAGSLVKEAKIGIFGFTFKEDCPDTRNTRVIDIVKELNEYDVSPLIFDPIADKIEAKSVYGLTLNSEAELVGLDALIIAVDHQVFKTYQISDWLKRFKDNGAKVIIDVKGVVSPESLENKEVNYWRL